MVTDCNTVKRISQAYIERISQEYIERISQEYIESISEAQAYDIECISKAHSVRVLSVCYT